LTQSGEYAKDTKHPRSEFVAQSDERTTNAQDIVWMGRTSVLGL